jgi:GNAT superfamily N-acetyltransferase
MTLDASVRPAHKGDLDAILKLWASLMDEGRAADSRYRVTDGILDDLRHPVASDWFRPILPFPYVWVAALPTGVVGFLTGEVKPPHPLLVTTPTARVNDLFVAPKARRCGLARTMVQSFFQQATDAGFTRHSVHTLAQDARAVSFWRSLGFNDLFTELTREASSPP